MKRWSVLWMSVLLGMSLVGHGGCIRKSENNDKKPIDEEPVDEKPADKDEEPTDGPRVEEFELPEYAKEYMKKVEKARSGEAVDFDGDGFAEHRQWTDADGVEHMEMRAPNGKIHSAFKTWPDGSEISTYSRYADDIVDSQMERKFGHEVQLYDRNRAGFFNERLTLITNFETEMIHYTLEKRTSATEDWTTIEALVIPPSHGGLGIKLRKEFIKRGLIKDDLKKNANEPLDTSSAPSKTVEQQLLFEASEDDQREWNVGPPNIVVEGNFQGLPFQGATQCSHADARQIYEALLHVHDMSARS